MLGGWLPAPFFYMRGKYKMTKDNLIGAVLSTIAIIGIVIGEIFLDHMLLIACADDELMIAVVGIYLHDMPEDRFSADLDHGLRFQMTFFADAGAEAPCQDDNLHINLSC